MAVVNVKRENHSNKSRQFFGFKSQNKFVRTKMRLKLGTKIDLSKRFVRFVRLICQICQILFSNDSMSFPRDFHDLVISSPKASNGQRFPCPALLSS